MPELQENGRDAPIDHAALAEITRGDAGVERRLLAVFRSATAVDGGALREAIQQHNLPELVRAVHRVSGASKMAGAVRLATLCESLAQAGHAANWEAITASSDPLINELERVDAYLARALNTPS